MSILDRIGVYPPKMPSKTNNNASSRHFVFRKYATVGAADAIDDKMYLSEAFVETGAFDILCDKNRVESLILGRTGSGKSALIERIYEKNEKVIRISPDALSLTYIANNDVLNFFLEAGVEMDIFYRLLWRHVFAVELIKEACHIDNESKSNNFLTQFFDRFRGNNPNKEAINYLIGRGSSLWQDTEHRVTEVTRVLENDLSGAISAEIGIGVGKGNLSAAKAKNLTETQKVEVVNRGKTVVNNVQMAQLSRVIDILDTEILTDDQKVYYITIDKLDENWVSDNIRHHLIKALIDTVKDFNNRIKNAKIIIALREDLLNRVFETTRSAGHQEEKYQSMYLLLSWDAKEIEYLLDLRVNKMVKEAYTKKETNLRDLLPPQISKTDSVAYIMERTMLRPRDAILFFNACISAGEGQPRITQSMVYQAEEGYSRTRLDALADEWNIDYPDIKQAINIFKQFPCRFRKKDVIERFEERLVDFLTTTTEAEGTLYKTSLDFYEQSDISGAFQYLLTVLFKVGALGVKPETFTEVLWSYRGKRLPNGNIRDEATIHIHPGLWRALGISPSSNRE